MMSCACGRRSIGNVRAQSVRIGFRAADDERRERGGRPRVHDVGIANKAAGNAALVRAIAVRHVGAKDRSEAATRPAAAGVIDRACHPR